MTTQGRRRFLPPTSGRGFLRRSWNWESALCAVLLPKQIPKAEVQAWLSRSSFGRRLEFLDCLIGPLKPVECFARQHVGLRGIRIRRNDLPVLLQSAFVHLRVEAALCQHATQLKIFRGMLDRKLQVWDRIRELFVPQYSYPKGSEDWNRWQQQRQL